ncbi:MAG TPA: hypothetical protein VFD82_18710 [Planctomycetota bacterium]|nr:hypothetical protein [Planctomycetota bacterium]
MLAAPLPLLILAFLAGAPRAQTPPVAPDHTAELAALPVQPAVERGVRVIVRDAAGELVAGADLVFVASDDPKYLDSAAPAAAAFPGDEVAMNAFRFVAGGAARYTSDERGVAAIARRSGRVLAWKDGRFAAAALQVEEGLPSPRVSLTLAEPLTLTAEVIDDKDQPVAGVPVSIAAPGWPTLPRLATDDKGRAVFRLLKGRDATARLLIASNARIEAAVPADGGIVRLRLPACGAVHATFTGALLPGSVVLWSMRTGSRTVEPTTTGERDATFAFVEVGYGGEVQAAADSSTTKAPTPEVKAGAVTEVGLARGDDGRCLTARLLMPDGVPARKHYVRVMWQYDRGSSTSGATTNAEGWLEIEVPKGAAGTAKLCLAVHAGAWSTPVAGAIDLEVTDAEKGRIERGELRTTKPPVVLTGIVVDTADRPVPGLELREVQRSIQGTKTDKDGRFRIAMPGEKPPELTLALRGQPWFFTDPPSTTRSFPTDREARVVLQPAGRVRFTAEGLRDILHPFALRLESADGTGLRIELPLQFGREHLLLPGGHWNVLITRNDTVVLELDNLRVDAGIEVHDPRFMAFAWQGFASLVTLHVEDEQGRPTDQCSVMMQHLGFGRGRSPVGGLLQCLVQKDVGRISIEPNDKKFGTVDLGAVSGDQYMRFGAGPRLAVNVAPPPKLPSGAQLLARVAGRDEPVPLDGEGKAVVWLAKAGDCAVQLLLRVQGGEHALPAQRSVDVPLGGAVLAFATNAELQAAIDAQAGSRADK